MRRRALIGGFVGVAALFVARAALAAVSNSFNNEYYTIVNAAATNNAADVKVFISKRVNLNVADPQGRTALSFAAQLGNSEIAQLLLDAGATVDLRDKLGNAPLHFAAEGGKLEVAKALVAARATVDLPIRQGITPLMLAIGHGQAAVVKALLAVGADPRKTDFTGRDAFGWAARQPAILQILRETPKS